jgi:hypothetical protein
MYSTFAPNEQLLNRRDHVIARGNVHLGQSQGKAEDGHARESQNHENVASIAVYLTSWSGTGRRRGRGGASGSSSGTVTRVGSVRGRGFISSGRRVKMAGNHAGQARRENRREKRRERSLSCGD